MKNLRLNQLSEVMLDEKEMCQLSGGGTPGCCQCSCKHADYGGSSTSANDCANNAGGYVSDPYAQPCREPTIPKPYPYVPDTAVQESVCNWRLL